MKLTEHDIKIILNAFQCLEEDPKINYELLSRKLNLKTEKSARHVWGRLFAEMRNSSAEGGKQPGPSPKKNAISRKRTVPDEHDDDSDDAPRTKKQDLMRKLRKGAAKKKADHQVGEADGDAAA